MKTANPANLDVFNIMATTFEPMESKRSNLKTVRRLFNEFQAQYTMDDMCHNPELAELYEYLSTQCKRVNGNFYHEPEKKMCQLMESYLNYNPLQILVK